MNLTYLLHESARCNIFTRLAASPFNLSRRFGSTFRPRTMRLALAYGFALVMSSALRLPATRLPSRRSGRPVAQVSSGDAEKDAAKATDANAAALSRGQQALEQIRATAEAQAEATVPAPALRWDQRARASVWRKLKPWVPSVAGLRRELESNIALKGFGFTQREKARA